MVGLQLAAVGRVAGTRGDYEACSAATRAMIMIMHRNEEKDAAGEAAPESSSSIDSIPEHIEPVPVAAPALSLASTAPRASPPPQGTSRELLPLLLLLLAFQLCVLLIAESKEEKRGPQTNASR